MLKTDIIWPASCRFKSQSEWEPVGFFSECLCNATTFDLMLGFFSSSAINVLSDGFATFLYSGGKMRLIINDLLSEEDKGAILQGEGNTLLPAFDLGNIETLKNTLSERDIHFFECIAWLIRNNRIEIRIIAPKGGNGIAHTKCGVFDDGVNKVGFEGSVNFSRTALIENKESLIAMCDWNGNTETESIKDIETEFNRIIAGQDETVRYIKADEIRTQITDSFKDKELKELLEDEARLLDQPSEHLSETVLQALRNARKRVQKAIDSFNEKIVIDNSEPHFPYPTGPRPYQNEAFENWKNNNQQGLFAMATGTGKTITALNCLLEICKRNGYYKAIILVPTITLVNQWEEECRKFFFTNIIKVYSKNPEWHSKLELLRMADKYRKADEPTPNFIVISTYASFIRDKVFNELSHFERNKLLLIADEAHNMGSPSMLRRMRNITYLRRIGLSATPERQFDTETNKKLYHFFGSDNKFTYEYSMEEAIKNGVLCRYYYYPHLVRLTDCEMEQYIELSEKISKYFNYNSGDFDKRDDILMSLLLARKRIIHKAANKLEIFRSIIKERYQRKGNLKYSLIYVPEGNQPDYWPDNALFEKREQIEDDSDSNHLIDIYTGEITKIDKYITVRKFVSGQKDREEILNDFSTGKLQVLTSMKCLDEGVDVPRSELAIFCASTGNPRQFIQRRGRVLRKHPDKHMAEIHDLVVAPEISAGSNSFRMEQILLKGELQRVKNFSMLSENPSFSQMELKTVMEHYGLNMYNNSHI